MREAAEYLGLEKRPGFDKQKTYNRPDDPDITKDTGATEAILYLESRGICRITAKRFGIAQSKHREIIFPYIRDGEILFAKYLTIDRPGGKKKIRCTANAEPCLFGWQNIDDTSRAVCITEGEIDAMSVSVMGWAALSVPFGGGGKGKQRWIETEYENLERFDTLYLCLDNDEAGRQATQEIVSRLGRHRCRIVAWPERVKDANEFLRQAENAAADFADLLDHARTLDPQELRQASDYRRSVIDAFALDGIEQAGIKTPWSKFDGFAFRAGEVCLLAGINGHGKTKLANHIALEAMTVGARVCIASMEFKPPRLLANLTRQAAALAQPSRRYIERIHDWYTDRLWVFDVVGTASVPNMLDVFEYGRRRYDIRFFVIDNLAKCGFAEDDYNGHKAFIDKLTDFAKEHDATILLITHMRKREDEHRISGKMDIKGSGSLSDMVESVLICWRNKGKERAIQKAEQCGEDPDPDEIAKPDAMLICEKQRNGEVEPRIPLWFDRESQQFLQHSADKARPYVGFSAIHD